MDVNNANFIQRIQRGPLKKYFVSTLFTSTRGNYLKWNNVVDHFFLNDQKKTHVLIVIFFYFWHEKKKEKKSKCNVLLLCLKNIKTHFWQKNFMFATRALRRVIYVERVRKKQKKVSYVITHQHDFSFKTQEFSVPANDSEWRFCLSPNLSQNLEVF